MQRLFSTKFILNQASSLMKTLWWSYWSALKWSLTKTATKHYFHCYTMLFFFIRGAFNSVVISVCERKWENYWRSRPLLCKSLTAALTNSSERLFISPTWGIQDLGGEEADTGTQEKWCWTLKLLLQKIIAKLSYWYVTNTILSWTGLFINFSKNFLFHPYLS